MVITVSQEIFRKTSIYLFLFFSRLCTEPAQQPPACLFRLSLDSRGITNYLGKCVCRQRGRREYNNTHSLNGEHARVIVAEFMGELYKTDRAVGLANGVDRRP